MSAEISGVKTYFKTRLRSLEPKFKEYEKPFTDDNIGNNNLDKTFQITYGAASMSTVNMTTTQDDFQFIVELYFKAGRDNQVELDRAVDFANAFRIECMKPKHIKTEAYLKRVVATGMTPSNLPSNDQCFKISLTFSCRMVFGIGSNFSCT